MAPGGNDFIDNIGLFLIEIFIKIWRVSIWRSVAAKDHVITFVLFSESFMEII